jgi:uncharacterized membrane protein
MSVTSPSDIVPYLQISADPPARVRILVAAGAGALCALVVAFVGPWWLVPLSGWVVGALVFVGWLWRNLWNMDARTTEARARREDPGRALADVLLLGAACVSLLAVGLVLVRASHTSGAAKPLLVGLSAISVVLAWSVVHTVFSVRYARLYYVDDRGGVDFNEPEQPCYTDFAYLALTIGMTFQVSDTDLTNKLIRRTALRHAVLSYMFGAIFIAITINLIAGLSK